MEVTRHRLFGKISSGCDGHSCSPEGGTRVSFHTCHGLPYCKTCFVLAHLRISLFAPRCYHTPFVFALLSGGTAFLRHALAVAGVCVGTILDFCSNTGGMPIWLYHGDTLQLIEKKFSATFTFLTLFCSSVQPQSRFFNDLINVVGNMKRR